MHFFRFDGPISSKRKIRISCKWKGISIIHSAWQYQQKSIGLFFANIDDKDQKLAVDISQYAEGNKCVRIDTEDNKPKMIDFKKLDMKSLEIFIPKKGVIWLEIE